MPSYSSQDLLRIAKRFNNPKRTYLLVDPLQAKHIPVSPGRALEMMESLGDLLKKYPGPRLVIGFAETATAIGAAAASRSPGECVYLHTTREELPGAEDWILFSEEHSHAVEQKLWGGGLTERIDRAEHIIFVDDEISTGKTLINMAAQLHARFPRLAGKELVMACLIDRLSPEHEQRLAEAGIRCERLVKLPQADYDGAVADLRVREAAPPPPAEEHTFLHRELDCPPLPDPRKGVPIRSYLDCCGQMARAFLGSAGGGLAGLDSAVVLGTEECMYPALVLGKALEERGLSVRCHATTRSPIGICGAPGYPITSGSKLPSFYGGPRDTYIYDPAPCGALIVVSDAPVCRRAALEALISVWAPFGPRSFFFIQGGRHVWYL